MDIQVRFEDGTVETRDADTVCLPYWFDPPPKHPIEERWYLFFPGSDRPLSFCALDVWRLGDKRGWKTTAVWRITGQDPTTKALTGKWATCRVETAEEQIERLTAERDKAERESAETMELLARAHALACSLGADVSRVTAERDRARALYQAHLDGRRLEEWKQLRRCAREEGWLP